LGDTHTVNASDITADEVIEACGCPADYALECTGVIAVVRQVIDSVGMLGTCLLIGGAPADTSLPCGASESKASSAAAAAARPSSPP
jgi:Zn-dependent alcohol dehydrogenase